jgi:hypothetical protein
MYMLPPGKEEMEFGRDSTLLFHTATNIRRYGERHGGNTYPAGGQPPC